MILDATLTCREASLQRSLIIAALSPARFADVRRIPVVKRSVIMAASSLLMLPPATATAQTPDYSRAERFLSWHANDLIAGGT